MDLSMPPRSHLPPEERRALSRLRLLLNRPGLLHGSLHRVTRRCGKKSCHCAEGEAHPAYLLRVAERGTVRSVYVPTAWVARVQEWIDRDRQIRDLLLEISSHCLVRLRRRKE